VQRRTIFPLGFKILAVSSNTSSANSSSAENNPNIATSKLDAGWPAGKTFQWLQLHNTL